jgi:hypothetical protein
MLLELLLSKFIILLQIILHLWLSYLGNKEQHLNNPKIEISDLALIKSNLINKLKLQEYKLLSELSPLEINSNTKKV